MAKASRPKKASPAAQASASPARERGKPLTVPLDAPTWQRLAVRTFRFFASLKLAIVSLATLATVLFLGMIYEREYGNEALQEYVYRTWWFGLLLTMLGVNIFCAAAIRYPWKKRQTGFVVTHVGLLIVLFGSLVGVWVGDEGRVAMVEGDASNTLVRSNRNRIYVQRIDPHTGRSRGPTHEYPFFPGPRAWTGGQSETLSTDEEPFQLELIDYLPASAPRYAYRPRTGGPPMIRVTPIAKPPRVNQEFDVIDQMGGGADVLDERHWLIADRLFKRGVMEAGVARLTFQLIENADAERKIEDFLNVPGDGTSEAMTIRYPDAQGRTREAAFLTASETWVLPDDSRVEGRSVKLPGTDWTLTYQASGSVALQDARLVGQLSPVELARVGDAIGSGIVRRLAKRFEFGERSGAPGEAAQSQISLAQFLEIIMSGTGQREIGLAEFTLDAPNRPEVTYWALPMPELPPLSFIDRGRSEPMARAEPQLRLSYFRPPDFGEGMQGLQGQIDLLGTRDGRVYFRAINDEGIQNKGELEIGEDVVAFGADDPERMTFKLSVDDFLPAGERYLTFIAEELDVGQAGQGWPAARVRITDGNESEEVWVRRALHPADFSRMESLVETAQLGRDTYRIWYGVDREDLPFTIKLVDFRRRFDRGTRQASSYQSEVLLSDPEQEIKEKPITIAMNEPLSHRGYTFYQSSFDPPLDGSGEFVSVFQVRYDPTWYIIYFGCLMVVLGTFLQFYMRAGVFTDGGKRERERTANAPKSNRPADANTPIEAPPVEPEPAEVL